MGFQDFGGLGAFVGCKIVQDYDGAGFQGGCELGFDIGVKGGAVHRAPDHPGRDQIGAGQARDEGLGLPFAEWGSSKQAFAHRTAAPQPRHIGFHRSFVNEHKAMRGLSHARLTARCPVKPGLPQICAPTLLRDQAFFYMTAQPGPGRDGSRKAGPSRRRYQPGPAPIQQG